MIPFQIQSKSKKKKIIVIEVVFAPTHLYLESYNPNTISFVKVIF